MTEFDSFPREWKAACANLWKLILHDCSRCSFLGAGAASSRETTGSGDGLDHESLSSGNQPDNVNCSGTSGGIGVEGPMGWEYELLLEIWTTGTQSLSGSLYLENNTVLTCGICGAEQCFPSWPFSSTTAFSYCSSFSEGMRADHLHIDECVGELLLSSTW
ncbi:hypothetical protein Y032_0660g1270 [Ancylostoma ceylanicum]|uniref:Uncharacterized protein n=1 Tax=Ancylostoma ceylanicum TaxID=53326 RepID=A0A016WJ96_9BILA|nr:hypothetical protein Y032_0660g1270 [Ancylostoma ceylanicum]